MDFNALHHQNHPLIIANVWDASSALAAQQAGYHALGTSSAAIASLPGYEDGEGMHFDELLFIVTRIKAVTTLPLSVDLEAGYGDTTSRSTTDVAFDSGYDSLSGFGYTCKKLTGSAPSKHRQVILIHRFTTPVGPMFVCATDRGICLLEFVDRRA